MRVVLRRQDRYCRSDKVTIGAGGEQLGRPDLLALVAHPHGQIDRTSLDGRSLGSNIELDREIGQRRAQNVVVR
ncbi:hypothetical protein D3C79_920390 [compost metagenome]